ncbi:copper resistance protein CopC [Microbacterium galbinum]|uniref:Copper resistance protein CopC n=1 Tax=Microbacterium galbinum TaxID=2851646 RepID=A0ABY4IJQ4_9MICO|nr:copper resistance protein CopC [Microbacterium galbinum]UPL12978.1 copper resistance protein CopC [Microbacterium galbinum]
MQTTIIRRSTAPFALAAALLAAFLVLFAPLSASAHDDLISSSPAADSTIDVLPSEIVLTFSADLISGGNGTEVRVLDANENLVSDGDPIVEGATVTQPLLAEAASGLYRVQWRVVSSDGHPTAKEFTFTVTNSTLPTTEPTPAPTESSSSSFAPAPTATPTATPTLTADEPADTASSPAWIWILVVLGILVIAAGITLAVILSRRRRSASPAGSDDSAAR